MSKLIYQCEHCGSENCILAHYDVVALADVILCLDCDGKFTVECDTNIPSAPVCLTPAAPDAEQPGAGELR